MALVLTRNIGERLVINGDITIEIVKVDPRGQVRLSIEAPRSVTIDREEIHQRKKQEALNANNAYKKPW